MRASGKSSTRSFGVSSSPLEAGRSCTDPGWLLAFAIALGGLGGAVLYANDHGDIDRLRHLPNQDGLLCGMEGRGQFVFFCREPGRGSLEAGWNASDPDASGAISASPLDGKDSLGDNTDFAEGDIDDEDFGSQPEFSEEDGTDIISEQGVVERRLGTKGRHGSLKTDPALAPEGNATRRPAAAGAVEVAAVGELDGEEGATSEAEEFKMVINKTAGQKLGLSQNLYDGVTLEILEVRSGGLVQQWNDNHPAELAVKSGDFIVEVNGIRNNAQQMLDESRQDKTLELVVKRGQANHKGEPQGRGPQGEPQVNQRGEPPPELREGEPQGLDYASQICVSSCPSDDTEEMQCGPQPTWSYRSEPIGGVFCLPDDPVVLADSLGFFGRSGALDAAHSAAEVRKAWQLVALSALVAALLAFGYLFFIYECAWSVMWAGLLSMALFPAFAAVYFLSASANGGLDAVPDSGDGQKDAIFGLLLGALSVGLLCMACAKSKQVQHAATCLSLSAKCITEMPTLMLEPWLAVLSRSLLLAALVSGGLQLLSCGWYRGGANLVQGPLAEPALLGFSLLEWALLVLYIFVSIWIVEFFVAVSHFVLVYSVEQWFFTCYTRVEQPTGGMTLFKGLGVALRYHIGSLAAGSLVLFWTRIPRMLCFLFVGCAQDPSNSVGTACTCCAQCFYGYLVHLTESAYMDVALNSTDFYRGAWGAMRILHHESAGDLPLLSGGCWVFQLAGLGGITMLGSALSFVLVSETAAFSDPASATYVEDPTPVVVASALAAFLAALPFMAVFAVASETILYCVAYERQREPPAKEEFDEQAPVPSQQPPCVPCLGGCNTGTVVAILSGGRPVR